MGLIDRLRSAVGSSSAPQVTPEIDVPPLLYSWILSGKLAIGPIPASEQHWQQLAAAGFRSRISCCYPEEEIFPPPPDGWIQARVSLPDHRKQEELRVERLRSAIEETSGLATSSPATYLHCLAGMERSPLVAAGVVAWEKKIDLLGALDAVRLCHPPSRPIYDHLDILDQLIRSR